MRFAAGYPVFPHEVVRRGIYGITIVVARFAQRLAMFASRFAGAAQAEVFALAAPADGLDLLFFAHKSAHFLACATVPAMCAAPKKRICASRNARQNHDGGKK